ncbi:hypothetical protein HMPREF1395_00589 [Helicobacter pylori GAM112Ai]|nr:hypothetical protein HMPREF1395_00589 [Helicobacter pylori GAM112Ai]EMH34257.1 hypothetical protein HMPREF1424_00374 [Helicobacter pylori GAM42Ai]
MIAMLEIRKKKIVAQIDLLKNSIIIVSIFILEVFYGAFVYF